LASPGRAGDIRSRPQAAKRGREMRQPLPDGADLAPWRQAGDVVFGVPTSPWEHWLNLLASAGPFICADDPPRGVANSARVQPKPARQARDGADASAAALECRRAAHSAAPIPRSDRQTEQRCGRRSARGRGHRCVSVPLLPRRPRLQSRKDRPGRSFLFLSSSLGRFGTCAYSLYAGPFRPRGSAGPF
jgi:hypothetical protein